MLAHRSVEPVVETTGGHAEQAAHGARGPYPSILGDEAVLHLRSAAK